ncbi:MAG: hypothetical protein QOF59_2437, partial [Actinomycetota bacterium]|nr:hypothetical protein [Actinomycetota bacterium]
MVEPDVGQRPSFDAVYRDLRPALIRTAFLIVGSTAEAEELVQDAFSVRVVGRSGVPRATLERVARSIDLVDATRETDLRAQVD